MRDYRLALQCGIDLPVPECQIVLHQPKIYEIGLIGETDFFAGVQCLCLYKSMFIQGKEDLSDINNFQIFMTIMQEKESKDKKEAVKLVLSLLLPDYNILFTPNSLVLQPHNKDQENKTIDISNFEQLQEILRLVFCMKEGPMTQQAFNPKGQKAKEIAEKLMKGRERIAAENGSNNTSIFSQYMSILETGLHFPPSVLKDMTMYQLYDQVERFMLKMAWDQDVAIRLAGGKPDDKPDNWMKNIH